MTTIDEKSARPGPSPGAASVGESSSTVTFRPRYSAADRVRKNRRGKIIDNSLRFGVPMAIVLLWQIGAILDAYDRRFFPAPVDVVRSLKKAVSSGVLQDAFLVSAYRLIVGFVVGALVGLLMGFLLGRIPRLNIALDPIISALYTVPKLAVLPILLLMFGLSDLPILMLIAASVFFIVVISTTASVVSVQKNYLEPAQCFGATEFQTLRHVILPASLPAVFVSLRLAAGNAVLVLIGIEFVQGSKGLGYLIWNSWQLFDVGRMYVGVVLVAIFGVLFQMSITGIGKMLTPWTRRGGSGGH
ncbi:ABC transporter permease [Rhodococcus sp. OK302]|uniref:ABC transporter permease n=1 Tax=Rhodococcus sp. OK302 TaxID=1882769 RepID=UPI000B941996|nr:ABC transporter permease [Rhodococcus sp. OK302]OYD61465.1 NitT/TauT family transport system permease protein/sulfonate transport system permease protein [Rhodococcus sp. OK302]